MLRNSVAGNAFCVSRPFRTQKFFFLEKRGFVAYNGGNALIRVFSKTLKSVLGGRRIAAGSTAAKNEVNPFLPAAQAGCCETA